MIAQIETGLKIVDRAAESSDRWLFLAALGIIIIGGTLIINWLVKSLERKDNEHDAKSMALISSHAVERKEWAIALMEAKAEFLKALSEQQKVFREELSTERLAAATERAVDRDARHQTANALNAVALATTDLRQSLAEKK